MVKVTVNYNKLFEIVPTDNPKPNYEVIINETDIASFVGSLDLKGVETINMQFDIIDNIETENGEAT